MPSITRRSALAALAGLVLSGCNSKPRVVLYCAQDRDFAVGVLKDFTDETKLDVVPKFDSEATKSVGLYNEIVAEKGRPRCDVFWNNEILNTIRLQQQGLLAEYDSPSAKPYPDWTKAKDHTWHAFAGQAHVLLVNTELVADGQHPKSILDLAHPRFANAAVMAKPMFGTTATHAACLFEALGEKGAKEFYAKLKANGVHIAPGNKQAAEWVGQGKTPTGRPAVVAVTDTDDAIDEGRAGRPVAIVFPDTGSGLGTLFIPNSLMLLKGAPNPEGGKKLIDFLLSPEVEAKLAEGPGAQIPLNPEAKARLPREIEVGRKVKAMEVDWVKAANAWERSQEYLTKAFGA